MRRSGRKRWRSLPTRGCGVASIPWEEEAASLQEAEGDGEADAAGGPCRLRRRRGCSLWRRTWPPERGSPRLKSPRSKRASGSCCCCLHLEKTIGSSVASPAVVAVAWSRPCSLWALFPGLPWKTNSLKSWKTRKCCDSSLGSSFQKAPAARDGAAACC